MLKSILKNVLFAVVFFAVLIIAGNAVAAEKSIGWTIQDQNDKGEVFSAYVLGDQGGRLVINCNPSTNNIEMRYLNGLKREYTFFTARAYMYNFKEKNGSVFVGMGVTETKEVYEFLLNADTAIEVQPYVDGTKERIQAALRRGDKESPAAKVVTDSRETFITTPSVAGVVVGMAKACPINKGTKNNL